MLRTTLATALLCFAVTGAAADFAGAFYDPAGDQIVVDIVYRGTHAEHDFQLHWGPCKDASAVARVIDTHGRDLAKEPYRVRAHFDLDDLECRPADVTLRMGRTAHVTVPVPSRKRAPPPAQ